MEKINKNLIKWIGNSGFSYECLNTPKVFYHKSRAKKIFDEFKYSGEGVVKNQYNKDYGFFFVSKDDKKWIEYIGDGIDMYVYLKMERPFLIKDDGNGGIIDEEDVRYESLYITQALVDSVVKKGFDSIIILNKVHYSQYIVFNPNQIKSIDNNGEFSKKTNNIFK